MVTKKIDVPPLVDMHVHLREGAGLIKDLLQLHVAGGADVLGMMPNTTEGLTTAKAVHDYHKQVVNLMIGPERQITPVPFLMITPETTTDDIRRAASEEIRNAKLYPLGRTTNSNRGIRDYAKLLPIIRMCGELDVFCHFHPEHPDMLFDNRDAEYVFLPLIDIFLRETNAKIVWEHGTDARCIPFWIDMAGTHRFFVTLTAHHLATDEDDVFGDVRAICKPPIKTRRDCADLRALVAENYSWVMAGTDSAPHPRKSKHVSDGRCACGAFTAPFALPLYAHALNDLLQTPEGVEAFVNFTSRNARSVHRLPTTTRTRALVCEPFKVPDQYEVGDWSIEPFWAGQKIRWTLI